MYSGVPVRLPGAMKGGVAGTVRPKSISLTPVDIGQADEVSRTDVTMDVALGVNVPQGFGHVTDQRNPLAGDVLFLFLDHNVLHAGPGDVLHHDHRLALERDPVFVGFDDFGMLHLNRDFAFARLASVP